MKDLGKYFHGRPARNLGIERRAHYLSSLSDQVHLPYIELLQVFPVIEFAANVTIWT